MFSMSGTNVIKSIGAGVIMLVVVVVVLNTLASGNVTQESVSTQDFAVGVDSNEFVTMDSNSGTNETVFTSRGYAVNLSGSAASYIESTDKIPLPTDSNWSVATWTYLDATTTDQAILSIDGRLILSHNATNNNWSVWYYNESSRQTYSVNVSEGSQPDTFTHLSVQRSGPALTLYVNNTLNNSVDITKESYVKSPNASNLDGRLEETRVFDDDLTTGQRQQLIDSPIAPLEANRTARIMYDEPYRSNQLLLFAPGSIATSNVRYSEGFAGEQLSDSDYAWSIEGPQIRVDSDSTYANYPVVYVDYWIQYFGFGNYLSLMQSVITVGAVAILALAIGYVGMQVDEF